MNRKDLILTLLAATCCGLAGCATRPTPTQNPAQPEPIKKGAPTVQVELKTSKGTIKLELNEKAAPKTVANFVSYVENGHYNGTIFHRVINGFMIQGGGFDADLQQKPAPNTVENEANNGLSNDCGTIAMARTSDPHSAGAQFFINVKDNGFLNHTSKTPQGWGYCVFGKVIEGMDVVDAIKAVPTGTRNRYQDVPTEDVTIISATVTK